MKHLIAITAILLAGCGLIPPDPEDWTPGPRYLPHPVAGMPGMMLYRPDPAEKPRYVNLEVALGREVSVEVWRNRCIEGQPHAFPGAKPMVYLCGSKSEVILAHELSHIAGMRHGEWVQGGGAKCAIVTAAPWHGRGYAVGQVICITEGGHEFVESGPRRGMLGFAQP